ncbi:MAG: PA2779 family protein [Gammaproteobacteria bacterium]|nr:PA2779 family protein [Gammaproteobacteria bacterium]NNC77251.1 PA2779 family protein [Woeseiaceae bacterium]
MKSNTARQFLVRLLSIALISMGFMQVSSAGMIGTEYLIESEARQATLDRLDVLLAKKVVAEQLLSLGVEPAAIASRLQGLTSAELMQIEGQLNSQVAGGDALGVIGAVFLVLLILELVGVTDIFKSL